MIFKHYLLVFRKEKWFTESLTNVLKVVIYIIYKILTEHIIFVFSFLPSKISVICDSPLRSYTFWETKEIMSFSS